MWPLIRVFLNTRPGVVPAPMEPGWRVLVEPWVIGPRWKWWRLTVPVKPRPLLVPVTSTRSPAANWVTSTDCPGSKPSIESVRNSRNTFGLGASLGSSGNWPATGLVVWRAEPAPS